MSSSECRALGIVKLPDKKTLAEVVISAISQQEYNSSYPYCPLIQLVGCQSHTAWPYMIMDYIEHKEPLSEAVRDPNREQKQPILDHKCQK
jgi:hypothetical protein